MKIDVLAIAVHPDDVELGAAGTLLSHHAQGHKIGIVDLTAGEMGTRGSGEIRLGEAKEAGKILGLSVRENLGFRDAFFCNDEAHQMKIIEVIRKYQPEIVLTNARADRHPDHGRASSLISDACFYSGLRRIETSVDGKSQEAWRPKSIYHFIQYQYIQPDVVVDISDFMEKKLEVIAAYKSQFYDPSSKEPQTVLTSSHFMDEVRSRAREYGKQIGVEFGEAYTAERGIGVKNLLQLL